MKKLALAISLAVAPAYAALAHHHEGSDAVASEQEAVQAAVDGIYDVISGPVGAPRDWDRMRSLMTEDARLTPIGPNGHRSHDIDGYIERSEPFLLEQGFFEVETGNRMEIYGNLAQVWSAYEGRTGSVDGPLLVSGINSFQLQWDGERWYVVSWIFDQERPDNPIPAEYLPG